MRCERRARVVIPPRAKTSDQIRDELTDCLSDGDALLVVGASIDAAWAGFQEADCDWLVEHI